MPIRVIESPVDNERLVAFECSGKLDAEDARTVFEAVQAIRDRGQNALVLYDLREYGGFGFDLVKEKLSQPTSMFLAIQRVAILGDQRWLSIWGDIGSVLSPIEVAQFGGDRRDEALAWLTSGAQIDHVLDKEAGVLTMKPHGALTAADFTALAADVDGYLETHKALEGLVIEAVSFPGWKNLAAFIEHVRFVKGHHSKINRIAVVSDAALASYFPEIADHFVKAEIRHFEQARADEARAWAASAG